MGESQQKVVALAIVFMILPIVVVSLRLWAKWIRKARLASDDYLICLALLFTLGTGICQLVAAYRGHLGQHLTYTQSPYMPDQLTELSVMLKAEYAFELLAQLAIVCAKLSLIHLYRKIFINTGFKRASWGVEAVILAWHGAFILAFILQCLPVAASWDMTIPAPRCVNKIALWESYAISDVLTDTLVLSMPIPAVLKLQMSMKQKIAVISMFLLGAIVIATGITRTAFFFKLAKDPGSQITYTAAPAMYWSFIETSLGTVCACLPTLGPIFKQRSYSPNGSRIQDRTTERSSKGHELRDSSPSDSESRASTAVSVHESFTRKESSQYYDPPITRTIAEP